MVAVIVFSLCIETPKFVTVNVRANKDECRHCLGWAGHIVRRCADDDVKLRGGSGGLAWFTFPMHRRDFHRKVPLHAPFRGIFIPMPVL